MSKAYTIAELEALADADLCALAAEFMSPNEIQWNGRFAQYSKYQPGRARKWSPFLPATNRNQSGELLEWARRTHGVLFYIGFTGGASAGYVQFETTAILRTISGTSARSETIAFCAAMLAQQGRLQ